MQVLIHFTAGCLENCCCVCVCLWQSVCGEWNHMLNGRASRAVWRFGGKGVQSAHVCCVYVLAFLRDRMKWEMEVFMYVHMCVYVWVLQRAAAGHIFPVLGPRCSPAPNWETFILTSGLWMQPTPSPLRPLLHFWLRSTDRRNLSGAPHCSSSPGLNVTHRKLIRNRRLTRTWNVLQRDFQKLHILNYLTVCDIDWPIFLLKRSLHP